MRIHIHVPVFNEIQSLLWTVDKLSSIHSQKKTPQKNHCCAIRGDQSIKKANPKKITHHSPPYPETQSKGIYYAMLCYAVAVHAGTVTAPNPFLSQKQRAPT